MNILQLRYFTTVAQLENISKAATILHLSQSSLSKNIAKLEEELDMPLFDRNGKKITLNAAGERFLETCTQVLREMDSAISDMQQMARGTDNRIKICLPDTCQRMIECMAAFRAGSPEIEFDVDSGIESSENPDINDFDVLIYPDSSRYHKFTGYPFYKERYFLAVSTKLPLSQNVYIQPQTLEGQNVVFLRKSKNAFEYAYRVCSALAITFASKCFVDSRALHRQMIAAGIAVGFVPEEELAFYQNSASIRLIPIHDQRFSRQIMICFRREKYLSGAALAFRDYVMQHFSLNTSDE